jgi:sigma-B regulation protein RsbU (phosphoserine phosphatase)
MNLNKLKSEELVKMLDINETIMREVPIGFCITDENGIYEKVNPHYCRIYGYSREELLGEHFSKVTTEDNIEELNKLHDNFIESGGEIRREWNVKRKNGKEIIIAATAVRIKGLDNSYKKVTYVVDITQRKKEEKKLISTKKRLDREIGKAKKLHEKTLPNKIPELNGLDIHAYYKPAYEIGGDFYNLIKIGDNKLLFYLTDITGHGLDAAMMSSFVKSTISAYLELLPDNQSPDPRRIIEFLFKQNQKENFPEGYFITIVIGIIDSVENKLNYSSAGLHIPLVLCSDDLKELPAGNFPISKIIPYEQVNYENKEVNLSQGSILFISTDGLFEQTHNKEEYGDRYKDIIFKNKNLSSKSISEEINNDFNSFYFKHTKDDVTYLIFKL